MARSPHVQKTKSQLRSLSACLQAAAWVWLDWTFVRMHRCPQDSARAHAPRLIPACVLTHTMHLCWGFCLRQRRAPLAVRANFSNRRHIWAGLYHLGFTKPRFFCPCSFLRACSVSGGRPCPALSRVHTYDLRQMLSNQEAVVHVVFKFRSDYFISRAA
jgi:hypothetical protein